MPQRLLIISFSPISTDARVLKQISLFSKENSGRYEVHTVGYGPTPDGVASHIRVPDEFQIWRYSRRELIARRYSHTYWGNAAIAFARNALSEAGSWGGILANDVDAVGLALSLPSKHGVHADLHEYAPRVKEDLPRWRVFVAPFMRWMCREFVTRATSVTTVSAGIADAYQREFGIRAEVVTNAAPFRDWRPTTTGSPIRLVHSGAALRDRHLEIMIDAVEATQTGTTLDLFLTPNDPLYVSELRERTRQLPGVTVNDPVPYEDLAETLNGFDVGVFVLPPVNFNYEWALPNKFFDYVQARLGVIIGPSPEMVQVLGEHGFGAVTDDFTAVSLARTLDALDVDTVREWKQRADQAAPALASEPQLEIWSRAIDRLMSGSAS